MAKVAKLLEVGVKYKGYGYLNEFGEWHFTPEETGSRAGQKKLLIELDNASVYSTEKKLIVHFSIVKSKSKLTMLNALFNVMNNLINTLREYEF